MPKRDSTIPDALASAMPNGPQVAHFFKDGNLTTCPVHVAAVAICAITASIDVSLSTLLYSAGTPWSALALCFVATSATLGACLAPLCWLIARITVRREHGAAGVLHRLAIACVLVPCLPALREAMRLLLVSGPQPRVVLVLALALCLPLVTATAWRRWQRAAFPATWAKSAAGSAIAISVAIRFLAHLDALALTLSAGVAIAIAVALWRLPVICAFAQHSYTRRPAVSMLCTLLLLAPLMSLELFAPRHSAASPASHLPVKAVVLITVDTLRWDALGYANVDPPNSDFPSDSKTELGRSNTLTPNIDALAQASIVFDQARACAPWTLPSCASLLTGISPDVHSAIRPQSRLPSAITTLAERLRKAGYRTAAFGDNPFLRPQSNLDQGFDHYAFYPRPSVSSIGGELLCRIFGVFNTEVTANGLTELACRWFTENSGSPVFLWVHYFDPHAPYSPHASFRPARPVDTAIEPALEYADDIRSGRFMPSLNDRHYLRKLYEGEVQSVDREIGHLVARLRAMNLDQNCLWVFTSDHGEEFWDHEGFEHGHSLYDELLRVPLLLKLPQSKPDAGGAFAMRIADTVGLDSVAPTILDVCGVAARSEEFSGASLKSLWSDSSGLPMQPTVYGTGLLYYENLSMIVFDRCKYIRGSTGRREQVFDLATDVVERIDLSFSRPDLIERGRTLLNAHEMRTKQLKDTLQVKDGETVALDDDTRRRLKALGYID